MAEELKIFDYTYNNLERAMNLSNMKQAIIAHNIANANTPGYVPLDFDEVLGKAVKREEGKGVVLEDELASLTENSVKYSAYIKFLSAKITALRSVVTQGRK